MDQPADHESQRWLHERRIRMTRYWFFMNLFIGKHAPASLADNFLMMFFGG